MKGYNLIRVTNPACNHSIRCIRYIRQSPLERTSTNMEIPLSHGLCDEKKLTQEPETVGDRDRTITVS
jgi:hypothetical protein